MESAFLALVCAFAATAFVAVIFLAISIRIVGEGKRLSVYRLGRHIGDKGPGLVVLIPFIDRGVEKKIAITDDGQRTTDDSTQG
ncbi:MAG: hypothetical protein EHM40_08960 [Chloroflexi bacterium]|nr:MAG: hypothetical protein EHM40_08960 [Chloroflexota bacterium]